MSDDDIIRTAVAESVGRYVSQASRATTLEVQPGDWLLVCPAHRDLDVLISDIARTVRAAAARDLSEFEVSGEAADGPPPAYLPTVYAWCVDKAAGTGNEHWLAVAEDGMLMGSHVSSDRTFGADDVHLRFPHRQAAYREKFGGLGENFYRFVVLPDGEHPPGEVLRRMRAWQYQVRVGDQFMAVRIDPLVPKGKAYLVAEQGDPR